MTSSIVTIESLEERNNSFGTGFVIDKDKKGVYILTCQHVLDDVKIPVVEEIKANIIAQSDFIDMAVIYVENFQAKPLPLEINKCNDFKVEIIGFSLFTQTITQKKHIKATLFKDDIELHSTEDERFYIVKKIESTEGYSFARGNSGSPVLCQKTKTVIALLSNKEGNHIGYAVDIAYLKEIWQDMPQHLLETKKISQTTSNSKKPLYILKKKKKSFLFYLLSFSFIIALVVGIYFFIQANEKPKGYHVVNIQTMDTLNVRTGTSKYFFKVGELPYNAKNIEVVSCSYNKKNRKWCNIKYGSLQGWVSAYYISP